MAKRTKRHTKAPEGITIRRDRLSWVHRKSLLFTELPELVSIVLDAGENGIHHLQLRPFSDSIEVRDGNGHEINLPLELVSILCEELPKMERAILRAETKGDPFEKAGLGKAPFTYLGIEEKVGPIRTTTASGCTLEIGSPGQPMGCCKYCGQGIAECHVVRSSDGKVFDVGCDCIRKVAAKGSKIRTDAERASNDRKNAARRERENARRAKADAEARERLTALLAQLERVRPALAAEPHPVIPGKTLADYVDYCVSAGIATGRVVAILEKVVAA